MLQARAAVREAAFGYPQEARRAAAAALNITSASQGVLAEATLALGMLGDTAVVQALTQNLDQQYGADTQLQSLWLPAIRAELSLNTKNPSAATLQLRNALPPLEYGSIVFENSGSCLYPTYIRGEAYLAVGNGSAAAVEFRKILDHSGIVWNCWTGALARLEVARADALQAKNSQPGDAEVARARARAEYKSFLNLWKDADADIPVYKQAKTEYLKLQ